MAGTYVRVNATEAVQYLQQVRKTAMQFGKARTVVGSPLPYAFGIETGKTRRGRLARRAGGAYMLRRGFEDSKSRIKPLIVDAFKRRRSDVPLAEANIGRMIVAAIQKHTPVVSGRLRDSFKYMIR